MSDKEDIPNEKTIYLKLGDIIKINENEYYIEYIDQTKIKTINTKTLEKKLLKINEEYKLTEEDNTIIDGYIQLIYRNPKEGFCKQNNLNLNKWLHIQFPQEDIIGKITEVEEDMIELELIPNKEKIYINFAYKGIPDYLPIIQIKIIPHPHLEIVHEGKQTSVVETQFLDEIRFLDNLDDIEQTVNIDASKFRYDLNDQKVDLLNDIISKIPLNDRTSSKLNDIHTIIQRFHQLRKQFSNFDKYGNIVNAITKGHLWKPLYNNLKTFKVKLHWILPSTSNIKKIYDIPEEDIQDNRVILGESFDKLKNIYKNIQFSEDVKSYNYMEYLRIISEQFKPFEYTNLASNVLENIYVSYDTNVLLNNDDDFNSVVISNTKQRQEYINDIHTKQFVTGMYIQGNQIINAETITTTKMKYKLEDVSLTTEYIQLLSILMLPESVVQFSKITLPGTNILDRTQLSLNFIDYYELLQSKIMNIKINRDFLYEEDKIKLLKQKIYTDKYITKNKIKNYSLTDKVKEQEDIYNHFLDLIIPNSKILFNIVKKYITGKMSVYDVITYLEPFLIYQDDVTFKFYKDSIIPFIKEKSDQYKINYNSKQFDFIQLSGIIQRLNSKTHPIIKDKKTSLDELCSDYQIINNEIHPSSSELYHYTNMSDFSQLFHYSFIYGKLDLLVNSKINDLVEQRKDGIIIDSSENCKKYTISKEYKNETELKRDDDLVIYFDKKFDKTNYFIFEDKNGDIEKDVIQAQNQLTPEELVAFYKEKLMKKGYNEEDAEYMANTLLYNRKKVREGDLAIIYQDSSVNYYQRDKDKWRRIQLDDTKVYSTESDDLLCNFREKCMENSENNCVSMSSVSSTITKKNLGKVLNEFEQRVEITKEQLKEKITSDYKYHKEILPILIHLEKYKTFEKYEIIKRQLSDEMKKEMKSQDEITVSPYLKIRDLILGYPEFSTRQKDIIRFKESFTIDPINDIELDSYWFYCNKTNTKLLPTFIYDLAFVYVNDTNNYQNKIQEICKNQGAISQDGDSWVDKHSGYVICKINFEANDSYNISLVEQEDIEGIIQDDENIETSIKRANYMEYDKIEQIQTILQLLLDNMNIQIDMYTRNEFIINMVHKQMIRIERRVETDEAFISKKPEEKEKFIRDNIFFNTIGTLLYALQTNIPSVEVNFLSEKYKFIMNDFPTREEGDLSAVEFLYTVYKTIPELTTIYKTKDDTFKKNIKACCNNIRKTPGDFIKMRIENKKSYVTTDIQSDKLTEVYSINLWTQFLPPLFDIKLPKDIRDVTPEFKESMMDSIGRKKKTQYDYTNLLEGKIIFFSLGIQQIIQNIVKSKDVILKSSTNKIYLENSCCISTDKDNVIQYFIKLDGKIKSYILKVNEICNQLTDLKDIVKSPFLFCRDNTKLIYPNISSRYTDSVIYSAFIIYCNFQTLKPLNKTLQKLCKCDESKPKIIFEINDNIYDKIKKLNENGVHYTEENLLLLLQYIGQKNKIPISIQYITQLPNPIEPMLLSLEKENTSGSLINTTFQKIKRWIEEYNSKTLTEDNRNTLIDELDAVNKTLVQNIKGILPSKSKDRDNIFDKIFDWKINLTSAFYYIKNIIRYITSVFPTMFQNIFLDGTKKSLLYFEIIPKYNNFLERDNKDITDKITNYYNDIIKSILTNLNSTEKNHILMIFSSIKSNEGINQIMDIIDKTPLFTDDTKLFNNETMIYLFKFYFFSVYNLYIEIAKDYIVQSGGDPGNKLIKKINDLLISYLNLFIKDKKDLDVNYKKVFDKEFKTKEIEKDLFTERLKQMTIEERKVEDNLRSLKLGIWGKGNIKELVKYKEMDENDRNLVDILDKRMEDFGEENLDQILLDLVQTNDDDEEHGDQDEDDIYDDNEEEEEEFNDPEDE